MPARYRRAALSSLDEDTLLDLMVPSYLRDGTPYFLWADTPSGFAEDVLGIRTWARRVGEELLARLEEMVLGLRLDDRELPMDRPTMRGRTWPAC